MAAGVARGGHLMRPQLLQTPENHQATAEWQEPLKAHKGAFESKVEAKKNYAI